MASIAERLAEFQAKLKELTAKKDEVVTKAVVTEGRTLDEHENEEIATLDADMKAVEATIKTLEAMQKAAATTAKPVVEDRPQGSIEIPGSGPLMVRRNLPKGISFARYATALALGKGNIMMAQTIAENRYKDTPEVAQIIKTAVAAGTTSNTTWAAPLVQYQDMASEFIDYLRPMTVLGRLQLRNVPFNIRVPRQTSGVTGGFVGEGSPAPVNKPQFDNITHPWAKVACITVITDELARLSNPSAEALIRDDLAAGIASYLDKRLLDPAYPGVANVSPASLTNGVTPTQASGSTLAALDANVRTIMTTFADAELGLSRGVWVMSASTAIRLSMMRTNQDSKAFPDLTVNGGTFYGLPVIVSNNVTGSGSAGDQFLILVNQAEIMLSDDGDIELDVSMEASLEMNDAPSGGATSLQSLWQQGLIGLRAMRYIYWTKRRTQAVQFIDKAQSYAS